MLKEFHVVSLSIILGPVVVITLLILRYDPLDPLILSLRDIVLKTFSKIPKEEIEAISKKIGKVLHSPKASDAYVKFKSYVRIYVSKYKYVILLVIDFMHYFLVSEVLDLWWSLTDISKATRYYPEMLPLMIILIVIWVVIVYAALIIIRHVLVNVVKDYYDK